MVHQVISIKGNEKKVKYIFDKHLSYEKGIWHNAVQDKKNLHAIIRDSSMKFFRYITKIELVYDGERYQIDKKMNLDSLDNMLSTLKNQ